MRRYNGSGYLALLKGRRRLKKSGRAKTTAYRQLGKKASAYRKRMIRNNKGHSYGKSKSCRMSSESMNLYRQQLKTKVGKAVAERFKQFWKLPCPPSVKTIQGGPSKNIPLMGMGHTNEVHISTGQKGEHGKKERVIRGKWTVATEATGKQVLLLSSRPMTGQLKLVGYAPVTFYIPPPDVESAGTHKAGFVWKHKHGEADGLKVPRKQLVWPAVYADRDGQVDASSNFVYGKTPRGKITTWMYH